MDVLCRDVPGWLPLITGPLPGGGLLVTPGHEEVDQLEPPPRTSPDTAGFCPRRFPPASALPLAQRCFTGQPRYRWACVAAATDASSAQSRIARPPHVGRSFLYRGRRWRHLHHPASAADPIHFMASLMRAARCGTASYLLLLASVHRVCTVTLWLRPVRVRRGSNDEGAPFYSAHRGRCIRSSGL